jgi:hypothetical protein
MKIRKVVCINETGYLHIKYGKVYDHIDYDEGITAFISIIDDSGEEFGYSKDCFISLEKWRDKQLEEIGI